MVTAFEPLFGRIEVDNETAELDWDPWGGLRIDDDRPRPGILQHETSPVGRTLRVNWQVGRTRQQDAQRGDDLVNRIDWCKLQTISSRPTPRPWSTRARQRACATKLA